MAAFDYQTNEIHKCNEEKVKKTPKQQIIESSIKEKSMVTFHNDKHEVYIISPKKIKNKLVTGYSHLDEKIHNYSLDKMYCIKTAEPSEVDIIVKDYKEKLYEVEFILINNKNEHLTKFYSKVDYNKISQIKSKQEVIEQLKEIEFLINNVKGQVDMGNLNEYSLNNLDKKINFSLDTLLNEDTLKYFDEIKEDERIRTEKIMKEHEEERKQQELESIRRKENSRTFKIIIGIIIIILLFYYLK